MPLLWACHVPWCSGFRPCALHPVIPFAGLPPMPAGWAKIRAECLRLAAGRCRDCGGDATDAAHIRARAFGGSDDQANLMALCSRCHQRRTGQEFGAW